MADKQAVMETYVPDGFLIHPWILKMNLTMGAKLAYSVLATCAQGRDYVWPSQDYLARCLSCSVRTLQRYLKELVDDNLIRIDKKYLMGRTRTIYYFLKNALLTFEPKKSKEAAQMDKKCSGKTALKSTTKIVKRGDKNDTSYNKEESFIDNNNIPPTPQTAESLIEAELLTADTGPGEGDIFNFGVHEENSKEEDPAWTEAEKIFGFQLVGNEPQNLD